MKRLNFPLIALAIIFFIGYSCKKKESDPKPESPETPITSDRVFENSVDTMVVCSAFDGSLVGNKYINFSSAEAQKEIYESGFLGGGNIAIDFINDTLISRRYDDVAYVFGYKVEGNQLIINGQSGDEVYTFDLSCEEKIYTSNGMCLYKYN